VHKKVVSIQRSTDAITGSTMAKAVLAHDERHIRRKTIPLSSGEKILIDLPEPTFLNADDVLMLDDGSAVLVEAAAEDLYEVTGRDNVHLAQLAWHIGNRHLPAEISDRHILILRDHVIRTMLEGLGATVTDVTGPFTPTRGAYDGHGHGHGQDHSHAHGHHHHDG
jgi:urease accessory protein